MYGIFSYIFGVIFWGTCWYTYSIHGSYIGEGHHHLKAQPCAYPNCQPQWSTIGPWNASPRSRFTCMLSLKVKTSPNLQGQSWRRKRFYCWRASKGRHGYQIAIAPWFPKQPMHWGISPFPIHLKCSSVSAGSDFHHISTFANSRNQRRQWNQAWRGKSAARHVWLFKGIRVSRFPEGLQFLLIKSTRLW